VAPSRKGEPKGDGHAQGKPLDETFASGRSREFLVNANSGSLVVVGVLLIACNAVLGLEDVKLKKAAEGSGGAAGTSGPQGGNAGTGAETGGDAGASTGGSAGSGTGGSGGRIATDCYPGEYVQGEDTTGSERICVNCSPGSYSNETNASSCMACPSGSFSAAGATECEEWTDCQPGTYVSENGDDTHDRQCADCEADTQSTIENQSECLPPGACEPGTEQIEPATETDPAQCSPCEAGTFCPGGDTPGEVCPSGMWDHDEAPGTECAPRRNCPEGNSVSHDGSATMDRTCDPCMSGTFSASINASSCTSWTVCPLFYTEDVSGTPTRDRTCKESGWTRQVGVNGQDYGTGVSVDANGNVYVTGTTLTNALPGQTGAGGADAFVMKFNASGMPEWSRQFGSSEGDSSYGSSVDADGNVYVVGDTFGTLTGQANAGGSDAFVVKYTASGALLWIQQIATSFTDHAGAVGVDSNGNVHVAGYTAGALTGQTNAGTFDAFVVKYDASGTLVWARQFGTDSGDYARGVGVTATGTVYLAGSTRGTLPAQTSAGAEDAFIARYSSSGTLNWTRQFGTVGVDQVMALSVESTGDSYIAGSTTGPLSGQTHAGGVDAFVMKYDSGGTWQWTRQFGTGGDEEGLAVHVDWGGNAFVAGYTTDTLPEQTTVGQRDAFVTKYDVSGTLGWTRQFGTQEDDSAAGVGADMAGNAYVAGYTGGEFPGETRAGGVQDTFVKQIVP
jgi:hypothetical protein